MKFIRGKEIAFSQNKSKREIRNRALYRIRRDIQVKYLEYFGMNKFDEYCHKIKASTK